MIRNILIVALGGAAGSVARYLLSSTLQGMSTTVFPIGTMIVNMIGCLLIGLFTSIGGEHYGLSPAMRLLLVTGFCGGFTTFSTFANETVQLSCSPGHALMAALYVGLSVALGLLCAIVGAWLGRML